MDGEHKDPLAAMARTNLVRAEEPRLNRKTQPVKVSPDTGKPAGCDHAAHVFDECTPRACLDEDAPEGGPEVALVFSSQPLSGKGMRLAWNSANDAIHVSSKATSREGSGIAPHRRLSHGTFFHRRNQMGAGEGFPLHVSDRASAWHCQLKAKVEPATSGANGDVAEALISGM